MRTWTKRGLITLAGLIISGNGILYSNHKWHYIDNFIGETYLQKDAEGWFPQTGNLWDRYYAERTMWGLLNGDSQITVISDGPTTLRERALESNAENKFFLPIKKIAQGLPSGMLIGQFPDTTEKDVIVYDVHEDTILTISTAHKHYKLEEFPDHLLRIEVFNEDMDYYNHSGLDWPAIGKAAWTDIWARKYVRGGSTIIQQIAKFHLPRNGGNYEKTLSRKIKEALVALELEQVYTKDELLAFYLNEICDFQHGIRGFGDAAKFYFDKDPRDLTFAESTFLAIIPKAPGELDPYEESELSEIKRKQSILLHRMVEEGFLIKDRVFTSLDSAEVMNETNTFNFNHMKDIIQSDYPYVLDYINMYMQEGLRQRKIPSEDFDLIKPDSFIRKYGSARVHTTLDLQLMKDLKSFVEQRKFAVGQEYAFIVISPEDGKVKAIYQSGDIGNEARLLIRNTEQTGSSFVKPLVYAFAMDQKPRLLYPTDELNDFFVDGEISQKEVVVDRNAGRKEFRTFVTFPKIFDNGTEWSLQNPEGTLGRLPWYEHLARSNNLLAGDFIRKLGDANYAEIDSLLHVMGRDPFILSGYARSLRTGPNMVINVMETLGVDVKGIHFDTYSCVTGSIEQSVVVMPYGFAIFNDGRIIKDPLSKVSLVINHMNIHGKNFSFPDDIEFVRFLDEENLPYIQAALHGRLSQEFVLPNPNSMYGNFAFGKTGTTSDIIPVGDTGVYTNAGWLNVLMETGEWGDLALTCFATGDTASQENYAMQMHLPIVKKAVGKWAANDSTGYYQRIISEMAPVKITVSTIEQDKVMTKPLAKITIKPLISIREIVEEELSQIPGNKIEKAQPSSKQALDIGLIKYADLHGSLTSKKDNSIYLSDQAYNIILSASEGSSFFYKMSIQELKKGIFMDDDKAIEEIIRDLSKTQSVANPNITRIQNMIKKELSPYLED
ncbi:MAG: penicillin-binding protein [Nanoarchaeota archaeon]|nr:penicillin-binding protein [Nanoarchaeota archaeon]